MNSFGTTETKLISHYFVDRETDLTGETIPVGRPIPDTAVRIVDPDGNPMPDGEPGEIEVHSRYIASQYQSAAAADQRRFASSEIDDQLIRYRTGDLGPIQRQRLSRASGAHRWDRQTPRLSRGTGRGRVDPADSSGRAAGDRRRLQPSPQTRQLIASYIAKGSVTADELQRHLSEALPDYMVPTRFVSVEDFPVNINGKVDRTAVLQQVQQQLTSRSDVREVSQAEAGPTCPIYDQVEDLVREALEIDHIEPSDGFVELGGDSLSATELLISFERSFGVRLSRDDLFDARSLVELAKRVESSTSPRTLRWPTGNDELCCGLLPASA